MNTKNSDKITEKLIKKNIDLIHKSSSLEELLDSLLEGQKLLNSLIDDNTRDYWDQKLDMSSLPVFGGNEPPWTDAVWSWDEDRVLVGDSIADFEIVDRKDYFND